MSQFFTSGDQSIGASTSAPDLPMNINLVIQYITKYSSTIHLAYRSWHQVSKQEELLTGRGKENGRW